MFGILSALYTTVLWYSIQNCSIYTTLLEYYRCTWRKNQYLNKNHRHSTRKTHPRAKKQVILRLVPLFIWKSLTINYPDNFTRLPTPSALAMRAVSYVHASACACMRYVWWRIEKQRRRSTRRIYSSLAGSALAMLQPNVGAMIANDAVVEGATNAWCRAVEALEDGNRPGPVGAVKRP